MIDPGLPDWRLVLGRLHATYRARSWEAAANFVRDVMLTAEVDANVRPPGIVRLTVPADRTDHAEAIASIAAAGGLTSDPTTATAYEIGIDVMDVRAVKPFWRAVLAYVDEGEHMLVDPARIGPVVWFQPMDEPRPQRNRMHIDVNVPHDEAGARIDAAVAAGGTVVTDEFARAWWVLADAEGNEACISTWQDRD